MSVNDLTEREERPAYVRFETRPVENKTETLKKGQYVGTDVDFALVTPPYSKDCHEAKATQWFENMRRNVKNGRIPEKWLKHWEAQYQAFQEGKELPEDGTPISDWGSISPTQKKMLISINIRTIEDLANANDEGLRRIGMGARELQNKAKAWLQANADHGPLVMENAALKEQVEQLTGTVKSQQTQIEKLVQQVQNVSQASVALTHPGTEINAEDILEDDEPMSELDTLRAEYKARFGKDPHHLMREAGLKKKLGLHLSGVQK